MNKLPFVEEYKKSTYRNPSDEIDPALKDGSKDHIAVEWYLRKMQYFYSAYMRNDAFVPFGIQGDILINRLYAQGRQPIDKYKDRLTLRNKNPGESRKGFMNMSWDICPILPKYRQLILGKFDDIDYLINVYAIDGYSDGRRIDKKQDIIVKEKYKQKLAPMKEAIGVEDEKEKLPFQPQTMEEADMLSGMGFLRLDEEVQMDNLLIATSQKCNWPEIKRRLMEDAIDLGYFCTKDYNDPISHKPMVRYVDPANLIIRQTRMNDFSNVTQAGEVVYYTIGQLREYGLTDEQLEKAAKAYNGLYDNTWANWPYYSNRYRYDDFTVAVLDAEFESFDTYFYQEALGGEKLGLPYNWKDVKEKVINDNRNVTRKDRKRVPYKNESQITQQKYQKLYRAKWVIGTDIIFDYGLQYDVTYEPDGRPRSSFNCYRVTDRSLINQCISCADDIQLAILRLRNAIAQAPPSGIAIEIGSLANLTISGVQWTPMDVIKLYRDTGDLLWKYSVDANGNAIQNGQLPIQELKGGIGPALQETISVIQLKTQLIRDITGINELADASSPPADTLVGVAQIAQGNTNNVLKPIISGYKSVKQRAYGNLVTRWQLSNHFYGLDKETMRTTDGGTTTVNITSGIYHLSFESYAEALVSEQEKAKLDQAALASMQAAKTGSIGITLSDYFMVQQFIARGMIRAGWLYLTSREQQMQAEQAKVANDNQMINNQAQMQAAQVQQQTDAMKIQLKGQEDRKTLFDKHLYDRDLEQMKIAAETRKTATAPPKEKAA